jgi:mannosyltransferase
MRPMSEEIPALTGRLRVLAAAGVAVVVACGIALRFYTHSALWLDEALTVDIARLPLHELPQRLRHDGAPPLFYVLLHFWMGVFGQSDLATRSLSGTLGVLTIPVAWFAGREFGGRVVAWTTVVLLASAPFAVYYSTEDRMYSLVIFLTACGFLALRRALRAPRPGNLIAVGLVTAALLYSQYWALYLVAMVGLWMIGSVIWARHRGLSRAEQRQVLPALLAVAAGCLVFLPWVPIFLEQSAHTGTPWSAPPNFSAVINAVTGFTDNQGSTSGAGTNQGRLLALIYFAMAALALFGVGRSARIIELDVRTRPRARAVSFVIAGTLFSAIAGGILSGSAFSPRYAAVVFLPLLLLIALGTTTLLSARLRVVVVGLAVVSGMVSSAQNINTQRTQAPSVAAVLDARAAPGDIIAFCPDQLGPSVYRVVKDPGHFDMVTFPRRTSPAIVDWYDYSKAVHAASATSFAAYLLARAGTTHHIWLVWQPNYQNYGIKCETIATTLLESPGVGGHNWVTNHPTEYYEPMNLTEYAPSAPAP